jgi:DNA ligase 1
MHYSELVDIYESLAGTSKKLEKRNILAGFLKKLRGHEEWIYLLRGRVFPDYDEREFGFSTQLVIKAIAKAAGASSEEVNERYKKIGDLGEIAEESLKHKRQSTLFSGKLDVQKVFDTLKKLVELEGKGSTGRKIDSVVELLNHSSGKEAKYIIRTILNDLRVGVAEAILRDSISECFFEGDSEMSRKIEEAYDLVNDFAMILKKAREGRKAIEDVEISPGKPIKVMLPVKVTEISEAFRICGKPVAVEHKYDGFRVVISKEGSEVKLFTRRLDEVTRQFPDIVEVVKKYVTGKSFILDSEVVGFNREKKKYLPFESISQRIKRKYEISEMVKKVPVEINVFDIL